MRDGGPEDLQSLYDLYRITGDARFIYQCLGDDDGIISGILAMHFFQVIIADPDIFFKCVGVVFQLGVQNKRQRPVDLVCILMSGVGFQL